MSENGKTKKERFEANPDEFIEISELILAAKRGEKGIETMVNPKTRNELLISKAELNHMAENRLMQMDIQQLKDKRIITAGNKRNFREFIRGKH